MQFGKGGSFHYAGQGNTGSLSPSSASPEGPEVVYGYYTKKGGSTPSGSSSECTKAETNSSKYVFIY